MKGTTAHLSAEKETDGGSQDVSQAVQITTALK